MFYDNYLKLCNSIGKSPTAVAEEIGIYRSTVSRWKNGKSQTDANIQKVADYFGVTVQELKEDIKIKSPASEDVGLDEELIRRLCLLTPEEVQRVDAFVQGILASR